MLVSVEILRRASTQENVGALVTLRDVRKAAGNWKFNWASIAVWRPKKLTSGVAHEIKSH